MSISKHPALRYIRWCCLPLLIFISGCQTTSQVENRVISFFTEMTYGDNSALLEEGELERGRLSRWETAPTFRLEGAPTANQRQEVMRSFAILSEATGFEILESTTGADITIEFTEERTFTIRRNVPAGCYTHTKQRGNVLRSVDIRINKLDDPDSVWCLDHELMHAFGFFGHSHRLRSVMSAAHHENRFTQWDLMALRILYHPDVRNGASWKDIKPLATDMIRETLK